MFSSENKQPKPIAEPGLYGQPHQVPTTGLYGTPRTQQQIQRDYGQMTDADAATGNAERATLRRDNLISQIPGPSQSMLAARAQMPIPATGPIAAMAAGLQRSLTHQPGAQAAVRRADAAATPYQDPLAGMKVSDTSVSGIKRIDGGSSPLFTNIDPAQAVSEMKGGTFNTMPAAAFTSKSPAMSREVSQALQAAAARGDFAAIQQHYQKNGGTWQGQTAAQAQEADLFRRANELLAGKSKSGRAQGAQLIQTLAAAQMERDKTAATSQNAQAEREAAADATAPAREGQQLQNQHTRMMQDLQQRALAGDRQAAVLLQQLSGKPDQRTSLISDLAKAYVSAATQAAGMGAKPQPFDQILSQIMPVFEQGNANPTAPSLTTDQRAIAIRDNPQMTRAQKLAALRELGYK